MRVRVIRVCLAGAVPLLVGGWTCGTPPAADRAVVDRAAEPAVAPHLSTSGASAAERTDYLSEVDLSAVTAHRGFGAVDGMAVIEGEVRNNGHRALEQVVLRILFLNALGRSVKQETYAPVMRFNLPGSFPPLKPGEVRGWSCGVGDVPESWAGTVRVEVIRVEFAPASK